MTRERVPVEELQRAVDASGLTPAEIARRLGWVCTDRKGWTGPDGHRVRRVLGLLAHDKGHGYGTAPRRAVNRRTADAILAALR